MARIRSLHPGQWTDESFVSCSPYARLLSLGLRNEADDYGILKLSLIKLKMRLLPNDNVIIDDLLNELVLNDIIKIVEIQGHDYILIRNFTLFQSPRRPQSRHFIPPQYRTYLGLSATSTVQEPLKEDPVPPMSGMSPERGVVMVGSKKKDISNDTSSSNIRAFKEIEEAVKIWNVLADDLGLPKVQRMSKPRNAKLKARLKDCDGLEGWFQTCEKIRNSAFLRGERTNWRADFDFMLQESKFTKLMEGGYDDSTAQSAGERFEDQINQSIAETDRRDDDGLATGNQNAGGRPLEQPVSPASLEDQKRPGEPGLSLVPSGLPERTR